MMKNKIHEKFILNFKQVSEIIAIDIPNNEQFTSGDINNEYANWTWV